MQLTTKYGNPPVNQEIVSNENGKTFLSYGTKIAHIAKDGSVSLYPAWNYSRTTAYYRNQFLGENTAATRTKIATGEYKIVA